MTKRHYFNKTVGCQEPGIWHTQLGGLVMRAMGEQPAPISAVPDDAGGHSPLLVSVVLHSPCFRSLLYERVTAECGG